MSWYLHAMRNYADFSGRARRKEYWMFRLAHLMILFLPFLVFMIAGYSPNSVPNSETVFDYSGFTLLGIMLVHSIPELAIGARRLHDTSRSGWWLLIALIPFAGFVLLYFFCLQGVTGENQYGSDPKLTDAAT
jgi:uncharacterized membrane protein YhaH (DUF805 family)